MSGGEVLDRLLPCLRQYLSLDHVRVYLMEKGLLTRDEYEQLFSMRNELGSVQVEWLVCILRGKGPDSADLLLGALRASLEDEDHPGHQYVVQRLQEEMERATVLGVTMKEGEGGPPLPPDPSLVEYLGLVNRLIDGLCQDPQAFDRFVMGLSAFIDFRPPASVTNLAQLFQHLRQVGLCSPDNLELLEKILSSMNRSHLVELVQAFKSRGGGKGSELSGSRGNDGRGKGSEPSRGGQDSGPGGNCKVELGVPCTEHALFVCSQKVTDWKRLATPLGLTYAESMQIEYDGHSHAERNLLLLNFWRRKFGSQATYQVLADAAGAIGDQCLAEDIRRIAATDTSR